MNTFDANQNSQALATEERLNHLVSVLKELDMSVSVEEIIRDMPHIDGRLRINDHVLLIEVKSQITPKEVLHIKEQLNHYRSDSNNHLMVVADYITPKSMILLKEHKINYLDQVGNMYLKLPQLFIHISGRRNASTPDHYKSRAFTKTGGAVVFQFLMDPHLVNAPQRLIAAYANVSLGTIHKVLNGLKEEGFLVRLDERTFELVQYEKLLHKWVDVLKDKILPAHIIGRFTFGNQSPKTVLESGAICDQTQWGGEPAAAILQEYLIPEDYALFTSEKDQLIKKYKLLPTKNGTITVYQKFWNHATYDGAHVHPILIYGQLMASGDSRNIESAEMIMNEFIRPNI